MARVTRQQLDARALYAALDVVRAHQQLTWRDIAERTGLSPSTFSRLADGRKPDADGLCMLIAWLRVPLDRFTVPAGEEHQAEPK
jgi:transcriptional regulator with XRE-family HTH domain